MSIEPGATPDVVDRFWESAEINLRAGKVRLVFVADAIPPELRRVVEFLNGQMNPAEVLAIEIKQYAGRGLRTLVPAVIGQTARARAKAASSATGQWDRDSFLGALCARKGATICATAASILD